MDDKCILCGVIVPEGRMICPHCENDLSEAEQRYQELYDQKVQAASAHSPKWFFWRRKKKEG